MAASQGDSFKKTGASTVTTLSAPGKALAASSINVGSTTNYPTDTGIVIAIRQVDTDGKLVAGTYTTWNATVASATSLSISTTPRTGSDQVYPAGSTTQVYIPVSKDAHNDLIDGLLVSTDQDGTLKAGAVDVAAVLANDVVTTSKILDSNVTTAKIANEAISNAKLKTGVNEPGGEWNTYAPSVTGLSGGTFIYAKYKQIGKTVHFRVKYRLAGAGVSPNPAIGLPVEANADYQQNLGEPFGIASFRDAGTANITGFMYFSTSTSVHPRVMNAGGTYSTSDQISATVPFTWTNSDEIFLTGTYEAA